jgi:hypothetical protein
MPHAVGNKQSSLPLRAAKAQTPPSRELKSLYAIYSITRTQYNESALSDSIIRLLESKNRPAVTKLVSLGLGSLKSLNQTRRIKQLAIFLAIADQLRNYNPSIELYAQDPEFSKLDESFLGSLGVRILSTPMAADLGEAAQYIDQSTLVYSPFLTLEAYELLFSSQKVNLFIGDDFDALRNKFPKRSQGSNETESISRKFIQGFRKRAIGEADGADGFWDANDKPFPMAMYWKASKLSLGKPLKAKY